MAGSGIAGLPSRSSGRWFDQRTQRYFEWVVDQPVLAGVSMHVRGLVVAIIWAVL